jgi:hypothetical protein
MMRGAISAACSPISCTLSYMIFGRWEALCARAWAEEWAAWIWAFDGLMGAGHCEDSHRYWRG